MKLSSYSLNDKREWGVVADDGTLVAASGIPGAPASLDDHIESPDPAVVAALAAAAVKGGGTPQSAVRWLPPVRRPSKVIGVAINNVMGQKAAFRPFADPAFFFKPSSSLIGHNEPVVVKPSYGITHPEPELAVIIGRGGSSIPEDKALSHVFGYTVINDVTSPGLKEKDSIPWIVTSDEMGDPNNLYVNSFDGDTAVFVDSTANLTFSVQRIIAHASAYMTLYPGDIIHCGTSMKAAEGGPFRGLTDWDLQHTEGRTMRIDIERIGSLSNPVIIDGD